MSQNGNQTKLFRNTTGKPGLRIRLIGSESNPGAVGANIRLITSGKPGPVRELRTASGYLSQDSLVQVMNSAGTPDQIVVRWPGGESKSYPLPTGANEISINIDGNLKVLR